MFRCVDVPATSLSGRPKGGCCQGCRADFPPGDHWTAGSQWCIVEGSCSFETGIRREASVCDLQGFQTIKGFRSLRSYLYMLVVLGSLCTEWQQTIGLPHLPSRGAFCTYSIRLAENLQGDCRDLAHARIDILNIKIQDLKGSLQFGARMPFCQLTSVASAICPLSASDVCRTWEVWNYWHVTVAR